MKEFTDSFKLMVIERTSSPFLAIFATAWLSFNWRAVLLITWGEGSMNERIALLDAPKYINPDLNFIFPAALALVLIFAYPVVTIGPFWLWKRFNRIKEKIIEDLDSNKRVPADVFQDLLQKKKEADERTSESLAGYEEAKRTAERDLAAALEERDSADKYAKVLAQGEKESTQKINELQEKLTELQKSLKLTTQNYDSDQADLKDLHATAAALAMKLKHSEDEVKKYNLKSDELTKTNGQLSGRIDELQSIRKQQQNEIRLFEGAAKTSKEEISELKAKLTKFNPPVNALGTAALGDLGPLQKPSAASGSALGEQALNARRKAAKTTP